MTIAEMRRDRAAQIAEARKIVDTAKREKREMSPEEDVSYGGLIDKAEKIRDDILKAERLEKLESEERELERSAGLKGGGADLGDEESNKEGFFASKEYREAFATFTREGALSIPEALRSKIKTEARAIQMDVDVSGGYLVTPIQMIQGLLKGVDDIVFLRGLATKYQVATAASMGIVSLDSDVDDWGWTTELATGSEDDGPTFGKRELTPHPLAKRIKISNKLLRASTQDPETLIVSRLAYKFGVTEEKHFLLGTGAQQPLGVFTASNDGVPTTRDVSTGNTATALTFDGLIEAKYGLKSQYWARARWLFHRDAMKMLTKIKDGDGNYMYRDSVRAGEPDTLLGRPIDISEFCPNTFTASSYVGMFCDWSYYWIVDALSMQIQRLTELYAETNQVGLIGRAELDGMPVLAEAFVRIKLSA
jgi:HK97 family phage major capsid protein